MLNFFKKRVTLSQIVTAKYENTNELHKKLNEMKIKYDYVVTKLHETWYLLRINNKNCAYKLCKDDNDCVYLSK